MKFYPFSFFLLSLVIHAAEFDYKPTLMFVGPMERLLCTEKTPSILPADLYYSEAHHRGYQISQMLFGSEFSFQFQTNSAFGFWIKGNNFIGFVKEKPNFIFIDEDLIGRDRACVSVKLADIYRVGGDQVQQIPMGAVFHVDNYQDTDGYLQIVGTNFIISSDDVVFVKDAKKRNAKEKCRIMLSQARKLLELPFQWGGNSALEGSGFDCSGLIYAAVMVADCDRANEIGRSVGCWYNKTQQFDPHKENLVPGDLILFSTVSKHGIIPCHVAIYSGEDNFIESSPVEKKIIEHSFFDTFAIDLATIIFSHNHEIDYQGDMFRMSFHKIWLH
ncbi:MAG: C40 family peptidase [Myxococcales bacterium]|nr:MAG: C40 family peptidase [Myxococcales bacterium]